MSGTIGPGPWGQWRRRALAAGICLVLPVRAAAAPKTDTVVLTNGDRLTCEIKKLQQARLTISTDPLGTASVHWGEVVAVTSPRDFEVTVGSGDRFYGSLGRTTVPGELVVSAAAGTVATVQLSDVTSLVPMYSRLWSRLDGNLDLGFSFAQANLETHWTFNTGATYRSSNYRVSGTVSSQLTAREDADQTSRNIASLNASRLFSSRWFATALGQIQQNEELGLELRTVGGGGVGRVLSETNHRTISLYSGLVYTRERFVDTPVANLAEIAVGGQVDFFSPKNDDFSFTNSVVSYYSVTDRARARVELQSAWRHEFLKDFYWSLNGVESFDSQPPETEKKNDFSVSLAIGWKF
ncbi:MAG TPA: DUF481 domain-containing protein [Vicinamibacterales bacterium]|nr:DUF481 domain-containing protein [Vicinamibacterales bacterium]